MALWRAIRDKYDQDPDEDWNKHTGNCMPEELKENDLVGVFFQDGYYSENTANNFEWKRVLPYQKNYDTNIVTWTLIEAGPEIQDDENEC